MLGKAILQRDMEVACVRTTNGIIRVRRYRKASSNAYMKKTLLGIDHRLGEGLPKVMNDMKVPKR